MFYTTRSGRIFITILIAFVTMAAIYVSNQSKMMSLQDNYNSSELLAARADLSFKLNMAMRKIGQLNCKMAKSQAAVAQTGIFKAHLKLNKYF